VASPKRGEIWWVRLDPTLGSEIRKTRPCVVITNDVLNERRRTVVVVPLSTAARAYPPLLLPVRAADKQAVAVLDQLRAVTKERFIELLGRITSSELEAQTEGLRDILDL